VGAILISLAKVVDFDEFKSRAFDIAQYPSVSSFLAYIQRTWNAFYKARGIRVVVVKRADESWRSLLERLQDWAAENGVSPDEGWFMDQMRAFGRTRFGHSRFGSSRRTTRGDTSKKTPLSKKTMKCMIEKYIEIMTQQRLFAHSSLEINVNGVRQHIIKLIHEKGWKMVTPVKIELKRCCILKRLEKWFSDPDVRNTINTTDPSVSRTRRLQKWTHR